MFIAHLPAGYLLGVGLDSLKTRGVMAAALIGSIFPDLDLFYFYLVDGRQHNHHSYWIHYPIVWVSLLAVTGIWLFCRRRSYAALMAFVFSLGGVLHIFLDLFVGDIKLFAPFSERYYNMIPVKIEAIYQPWWLNFILHWTFLLEVGIAAAAIAVWVIRRRRRRGRVQA